MSDTLNGLLAKVNGVLNAWEVIKENHHITDEIIEQGNLILQEEKDAASKRARPSVQPD